MPVTDDIQGDILANVTSSGWEFRMMSVRKIEGLERPNEPSRHSWVQTNSLFIGSSASQLLWFKISNYPAVTRKKSRYPL